mmetsp:Transcript_12451/g.46497  ORF Transcript_12451/g.46497 Transcript_12451/m.46497 type:complete len:276 (-) Transcript_12451:497-1324(-)
MESSVPLDVTRETPRSASGKHDSSVDAFVFSASLFPPNSYSSNSEKSDLSRGSNIGHTCGLNTSCATPHRTHSFRNSKSSRAEFTLHGLLSNARSGEGNPERKAIFGAGNPFFSQSAQNSNASQVPRLCPITTQGTAVSREDDSESAFESSPRLSKKNIRPITSSNCFAAARAERTPFSFPRAARPGSCGAKTCVSFNRHHSNKAEGVDTSFPPTRLRSFVNKSSALPALGQHKTLAVGFRLWTLFVSVFKPGGNTPSTPKPFARSNPGNQVFRV